MISTLRTPFVASLLALGLMAGNPAVAAVVSKSFEVRPDSGPLAGAVFTGSFSYDNSAPTGVSLFGEDLFDLTDFAFTFNGQAFDENDLDFGDAVFAGGQFIGLDAALSNLFSFLPAAFGNDAFFAYSLGRGQAGNGDFVVAAVGLPEPASLGLVALALGGIGALARRRQRIRTQA